MFSFYNQVRIENLKNIYTHKQFILYPKKYKNTFFFTDITHSNWDEIHIKTNNNDFDYFVVI